MSQSNEHEKFKPMELDKLVDLTKFSALNPEQKQFVIEACLGYYILNEPPKALVEVVTKVSRELCVRAKGLSTEDVSKIVGYVASKKGDFFGVFQEDPDTTSDKQMWRALECPSLAIQLNAHRSMMRFLVKGESAIVEVGPKKKVSPYPNKPTVQYGAIDKMGGAALATTTDMHKPGYLSMIADAPNKESELPWLGGASGSTVVLLKVAEWLKLSDSERRWYSVGVLGYLLAPGAHSLREVAVIVSENHFAEFLPAYRYCGFLGFELQTTTWYQAMIKRFGSSMKQGYWGDLGAVCYLLHRMFGIEAIESIILSFLGLPSLVRSTTDLVTFEQRRALFPLDQ